MVRGSSLAVTAMLKVNTCLDYYKLYKFGSYLPIFVSLDVPMFPKVEINEKTAVKDPNNEYVVI